MFRFLSECFPLCSQSSFVVRIIQIFPTNNPSYSYLHSFTPQNLEMANVQIIICLMLIQFSKSELSICNTLKTSMNNSVGRITFQNKMNVFQIQRLSKNDTIHFNIECHSDLDPIQKKIASKVAYKCTKDIITSIVTELSKAFKSPSMSISTNILCAFYAGINKHCPSNLFSALITHTLEVLVHQFHPDCSNKFKHVLQNDVEFWHSTTINNIRYLDIFLSCGLIIIWILLNLTNFKKLTNRFKTPVIRHCFYVFAYTFNITVILGTAFVIIFVSSVEFPYTFTELLPCVSTNTSKHEKTLAKKSKNLYSDTVFTSNLSNQEFQYMEANADDTVDKLSTVFPELAIEEEADRLAIVNNFTKYAKIHTKTKVALTILFNIIYVFLTWNYILFFFKNV